MTPSPHPHAVSVSGEEGRDSGSDSATARAIVSEGDTRTRPVRYYLDCEFNGLDGELLSMALCREGGGGGYFVIEPTAIKGEIDPWVADNVVPVMGDCPASGQLVTPENLPHSIGRMFEAWGDPDPIIVTDWPDDIKYFCQAVITGPGTMIGVKSLRFEMHRVDAYPTTLAGAVQHNAWWDALALEHLLAPASPPAPTMAPTGAGSVSLPEGDAELEKLARHMWGQRQEDCARFGANIPMPTLAMPVDRLARLLASLPPPPAAGQDLSEVSEEGNLREALAASEHDRWSRWMRYQTNNATQANLVRWGRQALIAYADLSEAEKNLDRKEADRTIAIMREHASPPPPTLPDLEGVKEALRPFARFRLEGFDCEVLEVVPSSPDNPARRIEPIWTEHFRRARSALQALEAKNV